MSSDSHLNKMLRIGIAVGVALLGFSSFYYVAVFLPGKEIARNEQVALDQSRKVANEYEKWKLEKIEVDKKLVRQDLKVRWSDQDEQMNDAVPYCGVCDEKGRLIFFGNGQAGRSSPYTQEIRNAQLQSLIRDKDSEKVAKMTIIANEHLDWIAYHIYLIAYRKIEVGMDKDMVKLAWGKPDDQAREQDYEMWWYWPDPQDNKKIRDLIVFHESGKVVLLYTER